jgi:hypothetical protein
MRRGSAGVQKVGAQSNQNKLQQIERPLPLVKRFRCGAFRLVLLMLAFGVGHVQQLKLQAAAFPGQRTIVFVMEEVL